MAWARWLCNGVEVSELSGRHFAINDDCSLVLTIVAFEERDSGDFTVELPSGETAITIHDQDKILQANDRRQLVCNCEQLHDSNCRASCECRRVTRLRPST